MVTIEAPRGTKKRMLFDTEKHPFFSGHRGHT